MRWIAIGGLAALAWACSSPTRIDLGFSTAIVHGVVTTTTAVPVANADVTVSSYFTPCPSNATGVDATTRTNSGGIYRLTVATPTVPAVRCVAVTVTQSGGAQKTVTGAQVRFKQEGDTPYDSVRVDVILP
jgi:hypothetical protein